MGCRETQDYRPSPTPFESFLTSQRLVQLSSSLFLLFFICSSFNFIIISFFSIQNVNKRVCVVGIMFQDITTLLLDPVAFKHVVDIFVDRYKHMDISLVAGSFTFPSLLCSICLLIAPS